MEDGIILPQGTSLKIYIKQDPTALDLRPFREVDKTNHERTFEDILKRVKGE